MVAAEGIGGEFLLAEWTVRNLCVFLPRYDGLLQDLSLVLRAGEWPKGARSTLIRRGWVRQKLGELGQTLLQPAHFHVLPVHSFTSDLCEVCEMIAVKTMVVIVPLPGLITSLADATPDTSNWIMFCLAR